MLIERIDIESFGKLKNLHFAINNRINVFYGSNESGKSTLAAFIKFMFFGYRGASEPGVDKNEKKLFTPWDTNKVAGSIIVHYKDRKYKIDREYSESARDRLRVIDLSTNITLQNEEEPGEFFFKMSEEVFTKTAFLKQFDTSEIGGENLATMIQNILFTADEDTNTQKTLKRLQDAKDVLLLEDGSGGAVANLMSKREGLKNSFESSASDQRELLRMEGMVKELEEKMLTNNAKRNELNDELENYKAYNASKELQKIESMRKQTEKLKGNAERVIAKHSHKDFIPDMAFSRKLLELAAQLSEKKTRLAANQEQKNMSMLKYNDALEKNKSFRTIENAGGVEEVGDDYARLKKSANAFGYFKVICAALILFGVSLSLFLYFFDILKNPLVFLFCVPFFILTPIFSIMEKGKKKAIEELYNSFNFKNESDFAYVLDDYPDTEAQLEILKTDLDDYEKIVMENERETDEIYSTARELLFKWNRTPESDDKRAEDFIKYAKLASEAAEEIQKAMAAYEQHKQKLDMALEAIDEKALRKLAAAARKPNYDEKQIEREMAFISKAAESMRDYENDIGKNIAAISAKLSDPVILKSQLDFLEEKIEELSTKNNSLKLAIDTLVFSCNELKNSVAPRLSESAGNMFGAITGGKYENLISDKNLDLEILESETRRKIGYFSAGTRDAAYLCLRIALLELLFEDEMPPLVCDESFLRLDMGRLENLIRVLATISKRTQLQLFVFTCHEREATMFGHIDAAVMKI
ncbi:MAG: AAA family ATPase [Oscillospiraceae bacterium]|nr:AAA family ATPase [Oscillospiraceae bacterium]